MARAISSALRLGSRWQTLHDSNWTCSHHFNEALQSSPPAGIFMPTQRHKHSHKPHKLRYRKIEKKNSGKIAHLGTYIFNKHSLLRREMSQELCFISHVLSSRFETVNRRQVIRSMWWGWLAPGPCCHFCALRDCGELCVPKTQGCDGDCSPLKPCWHRAALPKHSLWHLNFP